MQGLLKYDYVEPDATGTAHANIDKLLAGNREETARSIGTIGPTPWMETAEGQQTLLDMVTGSPGGAIGRVSKAAVTGGSSIFPRLTQNAKWLQLKEIPKKYREAIRGINKEKFPLYFKKPSAKWHSEQNKVNSNRIAMEKALDKYKVKHNQTVHDPITEILRALKYRKN